MGLDLDGARAAAEGVMADSCRIERDPLGSADSALDPDTLRLTAPAGQPAVVYEGRCIVSTPRARESEQDRGGAGTTRRRLSVRVPASAAVVEVGDSVTVTAGDPALLGLPMRVVDVGRATYLVTRALTVEMDSVPPPD